MKTLADLLLNIPLFENIDDNSLLDIKNSAYQQKVMAHDIIAYQGEVWPYFFIVQTGEIHAIKESIEGRSYITTTLFPNDVFWGLAFFIPESQMPVLLQANEDSVIYRWKKEYLEPIIKANGEVAWRLCQTMISRMQLAGKIVEDLAFSPVASRLSALLLKINADSKDEFIARDLTLDTMAAHIGTTREVVCRYLQRFADKGTIDLNRTKFRINDLETLKKQAGE